MQASKPAGTSRNGTCGDSRFRPPSVALATQEKTPAVTSRKLAISALVLLVGALSLTAWSLRGQLSSRAETCEAPSLMLDRLLCWFRSVPRDKPTPPKTRLRSDEAIALAQVAIGPTSELSQMAIATYEQREGRGVWHVTPPIALGATLFVDIDDVTGQILAKGSQGVR